jgi:lipopolysaccharide biosynthesis regulator YciM
MTIAQSGPYTAAMRTAILGAGISLLAAGPASSFAVAAPREQPPAAQAAPPAAQDATALASRARRLQTNGQFDEAVALFNQALAIDPELFEAHLGLGYALDLLGRYEPAREHLRKALGRATAQTKSTALSALAISYVFDGQTAEAAKRYQQLFDDQVAASSLDGAAATANALARLYLETGDLIQAQAWYRTGYETAKKLPGLPVDQVDLWEMRWLHAQSRLAARRRDAAGASTHAAALKALIDKGGENATQLPIYQYLVGYNAFHLGQYDTALAELANADQRDPFILALEAWSAEKKGDAAQAKQFWTKVLAQNGHSLQNALVRETARKALR